MHVVDGSCFCATSSCEAVKTPTLTAYCALACCCCCLQTGLGNLETNPPATNYHIDEPWGEWGA